jgi:hypothetical protein
MAFRWKDPQPCDAHRHLRPPGFRTSTSRPLVVVDEDPVTGRTTAFVAMPARYPSPAFRPLEISPTLPHRAPAAQYLHYPINTEPIGIDDASTARTSNSRKSRCQYHVRLRGPGQAGKSSQLPRLPSSVGRAEPVASVTINRRLFDLIGGPANSVEWGASSTETAGDIVRIFAVTA